MIHYESWAEKEKELTKKSLLDKLDDNDLSYEELSVKSDELMNRCLNLERELEDVQIQLIQMEYLKLLLLCADGLKKP